jgi:hypothetical protein
MLFLGLEIGLFARFGHCGSTDSTEVRFVHFPIMGGGAK